MSEQKSDFEQRMQTLLQTSAEQLDGATRSRLTQARHAALDEIKQRKSQVGYWLMPATGATAAAVLALVITLNPARQHEEQVAAAPVDEVEIVTAEDSLEFYRDVEFYAWLADMDEDSPAHVENEA